MIKRFLILMIALIGCISCSAQPVDQKPSVSVSPAVALGEDWLFIFDKTTDEGSFYFINCGQKIMLASPIMLNGVEVEAAEAYEATPVKYSYWVDIVRHPITGDAKILSIEQRPLPPDVASRGVICLPKASTSPAR